MEKKTDFSKVVRTFEDDISLLDAKFKYLDETMVLKL